jgi:hypothetical protein
MPASPRANRVARECPAGDVVIAQAPGGDAATD